MPNKKEPKTQTPKNSRGRPKNDPEEATKQKSARLPLNLATPIENLAAEFDVEESEIIKRILRLGMRRVAENKMALFSPEEQSVQ